MYEQYVLISDIILFNVIKHAVKGFSGVCGVQLYEPGLIHFTAEPSKLLVITAVSSEQIGVINDDICFASVSAACMLLIFLKVAFDHFDRTLIISVYGYPDYFFVVTCDH